MQPLAKFFYFMCENFCFVLSPLNILFCGYVLLTGKDCVDEHERQQMTHDVFMCVYVFYVFYVVYFTAM